MITQGTGSECGHYSPYFLYIEGQVYEHDASLGQRFRRDDGLFAINITAMAGMHRPSLGVFQSTEYIAEHGITQDPSRAQ